MIVEMRNGSDTLNIPVEHVPYMQSFGWEPTSPLPDPQEPSESSEATAEEPQEPGKPRRRATKQAE